MPVLYKVIQKNGQHFQNQLLRVGTVEELKRHVKNQEPQQNVSYTIIDENKIINVDTDQP